jgi:hypothetical protein
MKTYYKNFGRDTKDVKYIKATTWDGKDEVLIRFPAEPDKLQIEAITNFILGELDDHDAYNKFKIILDTK